MSKRVIILILIPVILLINSCGFHLQGNIKVPDKLKNLAIVPYDPYDPLQQELVKKLLKIGINVTTNDNNDNKAKVILSLSETNLTEDIIAYGPNGLPQRYRINLSVNYNLIINNKSIIQNTILQNRTFTASVNTMLSSNQERRTIQKELQQQIIDNLIRQLIVSRS